MDSDRDLPFPVWANFEFNGKGSEYFRIWIVNILLTIITIGIYSPWAKVRKEQYFHGNTTLNGSSFQYTADPKRILRGRVIAVLFFIAFSLVTDFYPSLYLFALATLGIIIPFALVASTAFRLRNTKYRNMRFRFDADLLGAYSMYIFPFALVILIATAMYALFATTSTAELMDATKEATEFRPEDMVSIFYLLAAIPFIPLFVFITQKFIIDRSNYGSAKGKLSATLSGYYLVFVKTTGLFILTLAAIAGLMVAVTSFSGAQETISQSSGEEFPDLLSIGFGVALLGSLVFYAIGFYLSGYLKASLTNLTYNNTRLGPLQLESAMKGRELGWIYLSNTIAVILSLGMLIPWSKVRVARYKASKTQLLARDMEAIRAVQQEDQSAFGEELGEVFGLDFGI